jgi:hypothetical protein
MSLTSLNTIEELIDELQEDQRGQVFLLNLIDSMNLGLITPIDPLKTALMQFINHERTSRLSLLGPPDSEHLADKLGRFMVTTSVWKMGQRPDMQRHGCRETPLLSRVVTYESFYKYILGRMKLPGLPDAPAPLNLKTSQQEVPIPKEAVVKKMIDSGEWRNKTASPMIEFKTNMVWLAPISAIHKKINPLLAMPSLANIHRDLIGLHWVEKGRCLIRLDIDLSNCGELQSAEKWRPHGAGNGGYRFRVTFDSLKKGCGWGRTVNMSRIKSKSSSHLDGIPEMVTHGFSTKKDNISATYLGCVDTSPENEHDFFINRLLAGRTIVDVCNELKDIFK